MKPRYIFRGLVGVLYIIVAFMITRPDWFSFNVMHLTGYVLIISGATEAIDSYLKRCLCLYHVAGWADLLVGAVLFTNFLIPGVWLFPMVRGAYELQVAYSRAYGTTAAH